jgi:predicted ATPase/class 3 adenylate cyclase
MNDAPSGTVTLLFTDIEGSTKLLHRAGDTYADLLTEHRDLLRSAFAVHGGFEVDMEGDSFFVVFSSASDAVTAAADAQRALAAHAWPDELEVRVRMGIHTGEPRLIDRKYVGLDVHRAARVMAAGHGGQVLLSRPTLRSLEGVEVIALGEHRLKDLLQPEPLYQLVIQGLRSDFPALKTLGNRPNNLPVQPNALIGREREVAEVVSLLREEAVRLLTLTGTGGTGKTRLALQVGAELLNDFPSGVFFVSLAPIGDPGLVIPTVAQTLAVREVAGEELSDTLTGYLGQKQMLLVLDNFEQVIEAAGEVAELLERCRGLRTLVTSRERLRLSAERVYTVPPLDVPGEQTASVDALVANDAAVLFVARAQAAKNDFALREADAAAIAEICRRLDGLPLALELAAARVAVLTPQALLARLGDRLKLLTGGARDTDERQRTLRATIEWSHDLLSKPEQTLFTLLSVFVDGCRIDGAESVCNPDDSLAIDLLDGLQSLIEKNLLRQRTGDDDEPRYWMLETIREYGLERLVASGEVDRLRDRHARHYLEIAERAKPQLTGSEQVFWLRRVQGELDNLRSAFTRFVDTSSAEGLLRLATALWRALWLGGNITEAREWLQLALASDGSSGNPLRIEALRAAAFLAMWQGAHGDQSAFAGQALALARASGDKTLLAGALVTAGHAAASRSDYEAAEPLLEESLGLAREVGDTRAVCMALGSLGTLYRTTYRQDRARQVWQESLPLIRAVGDRYGTAIVLFGLAFAAIEEDHADDASPLLVEALALSNELKYQEGIGYFFQGAAGVAAARHDATRAATILGRMRALHAELAFKPNRDDQRLSTQIAETARADLGGDAYEAALAAGAQMTLEQGIAYASEQFAAPPLHVQA